MVVAMEAPLTPKSKTRMKMKHQSKCKRAAIIVDIIITEDLFIVFKYPLRASNCERKKNPGMTVLVKMPA